MEAFSGFFNAAAANAGVLAGLVIVAISVNVKEILAYKALPIRAEATISVLIATLVASMTSLIQGISLPLFGIEVLVLGIVASIFTGRVIWEKSKSKDRPWYELFSHIVINQAATLPFIVGGILLLCGVTAGLYWLAAGMIASFILAIINSWVLLVEILR